MKQVCGVWLPDSDEHLADAISQAVNPSLGGKGTYQLNKYRAATKHVRRFRHALDIGANVGLWSRVMELDFFKVTAFEPVASHRECFAKNVSRSEMVPVALGAKRGVVNISTPPGNCGAAHVAEQGEEAKLELLDTYALEPVDFIKIDVEGYESEVVLGGESTIRRQRPVIIIEQKPGNAERYGYGQHLAIDMLRTWGMIEVEVIGGDHIMVWEC